MEAVIILILIAAGLYYGFAFGAQPEKYTSLALFISCLADVVYHSFAGRMTFASVNLEHALGDTATLAVFIYIALRANRMWPILACSCQLIGMTGHFAVAIDRSGPQLAYWLITTLPTAMVLVLLILGTYAHQRRLNAIGRYRDWRTS